MNVFQFLTTAYPPEEEWRPYPLLIQREGYYQTSSNKSIPPTIYAMVGKIVNAHFKLPNPSNMHSPLYKKCSKIQDDICRELETTVGGRTGHTIFKATKGELHPMKYAGLMRFCRIIEKHML